MSREPDMIRPNLFNYATSELSQDAFICWLAEWVNYPKNPEMQNCARDFIVTLFKLCGHNINSNSDVMKVHLIKQQMHKIDVYLLVEIAGKKVSFIIEDKTNTSPHSGQLGRYFESVENDGIDEDLICKVYYKTGYVYPKEEREVKEAGYNLLDLTAIRAFLDKYKALTDPIFQDYRLLITKLHQKHSKAIETRDFTYAPAQFEYLKELKARLLEISGTVKEHLYVYNGTNQGGRPWTHLGFHEDERYQQFKSTDNEYLFYRLDAKWDSKGGEGKWQDYLSIRLYSYVDEKDQKAVKAKKMRRDKYRVIFENSKDSVKSRLTWEKTVSNRGVHECEIAWLRLDTVNSPDLALEEIPKFHQVFFKNVLASRERI